MSAFTKNEIVRSFTKILKDKPFDRITISDIAENCGIARMTFYYHFEDIYDMLSYAIEEKLRASISKSFTYETWQLDYAAVFDEVLKDKAFYSKVFASVDLRQIQDFLQGFATRCVREMISGRCRYLNITLGDADISMICSVYSYSMIGLLLSWMSGGMREQPQEIVDRFARILKGTLDMTLLNAAKA